MMQLARCPSALRAYPSFSHHDRRSRGGGRKIGSPAGPARELALSMMAYRGGNHLELAAKIG